MWHADPTTRRAGSTGFSAVSCVLSLLLATVVADAKPLYVNSATGSDSTSYAANTQATPWKTIGRAAWGSTNRAAPNASEAARAGDVVRIAAGTYPTVGMNNRWLIAYNPANSGTNGNPIRFEAVGTVHLTYSTGAGPMIGGEARHYIEWSGFTINEATAPTVSDTGPVLFAEATGGSLENCTLIGNPNWSARVGDNYDGVRLNGSTGQRIVNNAISGYGGKAGDENHAGIKTYFVRDIVIEHNEISNSGAGIYLKGNNQASPVVGRLTIRYNRFTSNAEGIRIMLVPSTAALPNLIAQNIFQSNRIGLNIQVFDRGAADARHAKIVNNLFADNEWGLYVGGSGGIVDNAGHVFWNNIVAGGAFAVMYTHPAANLQKSRVDFEHNLYYGAGNHSEVGGNRYSLSSWRGTFAQDKASPQSVDRDPQFADPKRHDYRLRPTSPAQTSGVDRFDLDNDGNITEAIPLGPYVIGNEVIGRTDPSVQPSVPRHDAISRNP